MDCAKVSRWFSSAHRNAAIACGVKRRDAGDWWPKAQGTFTVLAWALALEWATEDALGSKGAPAWYCAPWGSRCEEKRALFSKRYNVKFADEGFARRGARRHDPHGYLVDFSVWPENEDLPMLTMESEMAPDHGAGASVSLDDGFIYDFYKILLVPSSRRLFVARVRNETQRDQLLESLGQVTDSARSAGRVIQPADRIAACVLLSGTRKRESSKVAVWNHRRRYFDAEEVKFGLTQIQSRARHRPSDSARRGRERLFVDTAPRA